MKQITLIVNPASGNRELHENLDEVISQFQSMAEKVTVFQTQKPGDGADFIFQEAHHSDMIVAVGGDGTVHECINAISSLDHRPPFAILPGGTCNDFSRTLSISQDYREAVQQILEQRIRYVDVGKHGDQYFLNFWGIGLITQVSDEIESDLKKDWGRLAYYFSALQNITEQESFYLEVKTEYHQFQGRATMMLVGNGAYLGGVDFYFPNSSVEDGCFDVLIIKDVSLDYLWSMLVSRLTGESPEGDDFIYFQAKELHISTDPAMKVDCDGEKKTHTLLPASPCSQSICPSLSAPISPLKRWEGADFLRLSDIFASNKQAVDTQSTASRK